MTTTPAVVYDTEILILKALAAGREPEQVAQTLAAHPTAAHLTADEVERVGLAHGFPDPDQLRYRIAELQRLHRMEPSLQQQAPVRAPARPVPAPVPTAPAAARPGPPGAAVPDGRFMKVRIAQLRPSPENPREQLTEIAELAASIQSAGLIQPLIVRPADDGIPGFIIIAGHRRHAAVQLLGWERVDVVIRNDMRSDDDLAAALIENGQRAGLDPIEEARALQLLKTRLDCSDREVAAKVGFGQVMVSNRLALLSLSPSEQDEVRKGTMTVTHAVAQGRLNSGRVRSKGQAKGWHLDHTHALAAQVRARCLRLGHSRGRTVGGQGCGQCWEAVIRADERLATAEHGARTGTCPTCSAPYNPDD
ncbi:ParB/RepB/Spo0J family partition protein [Angustibacter luteus]|uniref:ParB/RepB/Spo0J family partition protein n=1 Tax=Angustibacter luteus TaxID=658456 RepID=A0ABW1JKB3_9ACTN